MQQRLFLLIIFLKFLLIKSQNIPYSYGTIYLHFYYSPGKHLETKNISITTYLVPKTENINYYILIGDVINDITLAVRRFDCVNFQCARETCRMKLESLYISLPDEMLSEDYLLKMDSSYTDLKNILCDLSFRTQFNLTCIIVDINIDNVGKPNDPDGYPLSKTSLFGIIFLSTCIVLVFLLCIGWFAVIYYRRCIQYRIKKKLRKALQQSTQQMLAKSPVIIFDPDDKDNNYTDDDPVCAICLESFKPKEKIRKLICSHYFHITCVDPWLLSRQNCPLCNRNILRNSIPSISSSIMAAINGRNNEESTTIANNDTNQTTQTRNFNL